MVVSLSRRGFLQGVAGVAVIVALPKAAVALADTAKPHVDPFSIKAPPGLRYQWVVTHIMGEPTTEYVEDRCNGGWSFVSPKMHPEFTASNVGVAVKNGGLILMHRPSRHDDP